MGLRGWGWGGSGRGEDVRSTGKAVGSAGETELGGDGGAVSGFVIARIRWAYDSTTFRSVAESDEQLW